MHWFQITHEGAIEPIGEHSISSDAIRACRYGRNDPLWVADEKDLAGWLRTIQRCSEGAGSRWFVLTGLGRLGPAVTQLEDANAVFVQMIEVMDILAVWRRDDLIARIEGAIMEPA